MIIGATDVPGLDLLSGSVLGVVVLLLLTGWLETRPAMNRLVEERNRLAEENARLRIALEERVIPTVEKNTALAQRLVELLDRQPKVGRSGADGSVQN